jgi:hypothetical protein
VGDRERAVGAKTSETITLLLVKVQSSNFSLSCFSKLENKLKLDSEPFAFAIIRILINASISR